MSSKTKSKKNRREDRVESVIEAAYSDGNRFFNEKIIDLSLGGCQVETLTPLEKDTKITITITASTPVKLQGIVRWIKKERFKYHMGIQFKQVSLEDENKLRDIIHSVFWSSNDRLLR